MDILIRNKTLGPLLFDCLLAYFKDLPENEKRKAGTKLHDFVGIFNPVDRNPRVYSKKALLTKNRIDKAVLRAFRPDDWKRAKEGMSSREKILLRTRINAALGSEFSGGSTIDVYCRSAGMQLGHSLIELAELAVLASGRNTIRNREKATDARASWGTEQERLKAVQAFFEENRKNYKRLGINGMIEAAVNNCKVSRSLIQRHRRNGELLIPPKI